MLIIYIYIYIHQTELCVSRPQVQYGGLQKALFRQDMRELVTCTEAKNCMVHASCLSAQTASEHQRPTKEIQTPERHAYRLDTGM